MTRQDKENKGNQEDMKRFFPGKRKGNKTVSLILRERRVSDPLTQEKQFAVRCVLISVSRQPTENQRRHETSRPKEPDREFNGKHASNKTYDGRSASIERRILVLPKFVSDSRDYRMKVIQSLSLESFREMFCSLCSPRVSSSCCCLFSTLPVFVSWA